VNSASEGRASLESLETEKTKPHAAKTKAWVAIVATQVGFLLERAGPGDIVSGNA
jgi:hypothetical protein